MTAEMITGWAEVGGIVFSVLSSAGALGWVIVRKFNRLESAMQEFPPHRHVNGKILYPKAFSPSIIEHPDWQAH
jgi:hypothetical protein